MEHFLSVSFVVFYCTLESSLMGCRFSGSTDREKYKRCQQLIECSWSFSCREVHFYQEQVTFVVFYHRQVMYIDVGHIAVILVWDAGDVQVIRPHIMASIYQHNIIFNY